MSQLNNDLRTSQNFCGGEKHQYSYLSIVKKKNSHHFKFPKQFVPPFQTSMNKLSCHCFISEGPGYKYYAGGPVLSKKTMLPAPAVIGPV